MKERPILFSAPMVRAILAGQKKQTRRIVSAKDIARAKCASDCSGPQPEKAWPDPGLGAGGYLKVPCADGAAQRVRCRYSIGDHLWVRETWRIWERPADSVDGIRFAADNSFREIENTSEAADAWVDAHDNGEHEDSWRPSIFMPRWASRITLEVTGVRVERLQDIADADAGAEGCPGIEEAGSAWTSEWRRDWFRGLWDTINGKRAAWSTNPWVWVVEFKAEDRP